MLHAHKQYSMRSNRQVLMSFAATAALLTLGVSAASAETAPVAKAETGVAVDQAAAEATAPSSGRIGARPMSARGCRRKATSR